MAKAPKRDEDLSSKPGIEDKCLDLFKDVGKGFENQRDRSDQIMDNWDLYNCVLSDKQFYNGQSKISLPFIHDAVEARVTRYANQLFPVSGRYVEVTTSEADPPMRTQALLETYVRKTKLRTKVVPALLRNGDLEGTYTLYVDWKDRKRDIVYRIKTQPKTDGMENPAAEPVDDLKDEELIDAYPDVEVISDADLLVLPAATNSPDDAIEDGGSVTVLRRWSKAKIKAMIAEGKIRKSEGETLLEEMNNQRASKDHDTAKEQLDSAGIKERGKIALIYETWTRMKVAGEMYLVQIYFGGDKRILGVKRCPYWNDRIPIISAPVRKMGGTFKSAAPVTQTTDLQIFANDTINEAADTAHFSAMPIVMTDPLSNPRAETMTLGLAAVWEVDPTKTQIVQFPDLWRSGLERASAIRDQIFQTLGVNPAMIPQGTNGSKKRSQAETAMEQQVDLLNTADAVSIVEESILTPLIQRFAEYDHQFRDDVVTIRTYGEFGLEANMEEVEPIQLNSRFEFRWYGLESARNAAQMQQQISWLNIVKQIPPQQYEGYDLKMAPMIIQGTENTFGPRMAPLIFVKKTMITVDPVEENMMMLDGFPVMVHPADDDMAHIQAHMQAMEVGDPHGNIRNHIQLHMGQMQQKAQQQQPQQQGGGGGGGAPGGGGPKPGAQPKAPRGGQQPPGAIHKDNLPQAGGVMQMPRRTG